MGLYYIEWLLVGFIGLFFRSKRKMVGRRKVSQSQTKLFLLISMGRQTQFVSAENTVPSWNRIFTGAQSNLWGRFFQMIGSESLEFSSG
jgi:hypothetical protein